MTHERDLDRVLDRWMDDGPTVVADRVIATAMTDVHTTRQRGARWALLKELFMTMKPATTLVAVTIIAALGFAAYQFWAGGRIGAPPEPQFVTASELPEIVMNADQAPPGMNLDGIYTEGNDVLLRPIISVTGPEQRRTWSSPALSAGRYTEFSDADQQVILSWAALYERRRCRAGPVLYAEELESEAGYGLTASTISATSEPTTRTTRPQDDTKVYLWRVGNLVLAAATIGDYDPDQMRSVAEGMDDGPADELRGAWPFGSRVLKQECHDRLARSRSGARPLDGRRSECGGRPRDRDGDDRCELDTTARRTVCAAEGALHDHEARRDGARHRRRCHRRWCDISEPFGR